MSGPESDLEIRKSRIWDTPFAILAQISLFDDLWAQRDVTLSRAGTHPRSKTEK
jgi:hypothetical protein